MRCLMQTGRRAGVVAAMLVLILSGLERIVSAASPVRPIYVTFQFRNNGQNFPDAPEARTKLYPRFREEVHWLRETANRYGARISWVIEGEYIEYALAQGDKDDFAAYLRDGHTLGLHPHANTQVTPMRWRRLNMRQKPYDQVPEMLEANYKYMSEVVPREKRLRCDIAFPFWDDAGGAELRERMHRQFGFQIEAAPEFFNLYFHHYPFNAWRYRQGTQLGEDFEGPTVAIPFMAQIGSEGAHGPFGSSDCRPPSLKKHFLMLYLEWRRAERVGELPKIWTIGWASHPHNNAAFHEQIEEMWRWLNTYFINKPSPRGNVIAVYRTDEEILNAFKSWERENPGASSFDWKQGDPYPYHYLALQKRTERAGWAEQLDRWKGQGITCHRLVSEDSSLYLLWSDKGALEIDFDLLPPPFERLDAAGRSATVDNGKLRVEQEPILVFLRPDS